MIRTALVRGRTLRAGDWLRLSARKYPNRIAVLGPSTPVTYAELNRRVNQLATALADLGLRKGDRIGLFAADSQQFLEVLLACLKLGAVFMPFNFRLNAAELQVLLDASRPRALFSAARNRPVVDQCEVDSLTVRVVLDEPGYEQFLARGRDEELDVVVEDDELACIAYTSGTTGRPKGVMHSQAMVKHNLISTLMVREMAEDSTHYSAAPMFHISGMYWTITQIARGATVLLLPDFDPAVVLSWLGSGLVTDLFVVPTMIHDLVAHPNARETDFQRLRSIAYGGAPMPLPLLREAMALFGCEFLQAFGSGTEAGTQTTLSPQDHRDALAGKLHLLGSIGRPVAGIDVRICVPGDGPPVEVAPGEVGEIVTRAQAVMSGYIDQPEATARVLYEGWYRGGDMARVDGEGYLYLSGRKDDMIIRGGENIYPGEIEDVLHTIPEVDEAAVVGVPDAHWGQVVRAHVTVRPGAVFDADAATALCRSRLAAYKVPVEFRLEPELPKTATGKVLKNRLIQDAPRGA